MAGLNQTDRTRLIDATRSREVASDTTRLPESMGQSEALRRVPGDVTKNAPGILSADEVERRDADKARKERSKR